MTAGTGDAAAQGQVPDTSALDHRFRALYDSSFRSMYSYATRALFPDRSEIEDVVAEIYLVAWRRIDELPPPPEQRLWLYGVPRNVVANTRRSRNRRQRLLSHLANEPASPSTPSESSDVDVAAALERLSPREREVIQLVVWEGLSQPEAAKVLGCSPNAVHLRLHRARKRLARWLPAAVMPPAATLAPLPLDMEKPR